MTSRLASARHMAWTHVPNPLSSHRRFGSYCGSMIDRVQSDFCASVQPSVGKSPSRAEQQSSPQTVMELARMLQGMQVPTDKIRERLIEG